jgi:pimeloyl-ACP methyl ester carboxylesterase
LLLHGLGGKSDQLLDYFSDSGVPLIAPDQRAHGADRSSAHRADATFDRLARDQLALLDRLQVPSIAIAGMSMGAGVALTLMTLAPDRVDGLLLIRPAWVDEPGPENLAAFKVLGDLLALDARDVLESVQLQRIRTRLMRSRAFLKIAAQSSAGAASLADQLQDPGVGRRRDLLRYLPGSVPRWPADPPAVPVVVVGAPGDPVHPRGMAVTWARRLGGELTTAPGRDDDPAEYQRAMIDAAHLFCERVPSLRGFQS